jgi:hypothetical protein
MLPLEHIIREAFLRPNKVSLIRLYYTGMEYMS